MKKATVPARIARNVARPAPATPSGCPVPHPRISTGASAMFRITVRIWMPTVGVTTPLPRSAAPMATITNCSNIAGMNQFR